MDSTIESTKTSVDKGHGESDIESDSKNEKTRMKDLSPPKKKPKTKRLRARRPKLHVDAKTLR